jgi:hypothetical protein
LASSGSTRLVGVVVLLAAQPRHAGSDDTGGDDEAEGDDEAAGNRGVSLIAKVPQ